MKRTSEIIASRGRNVLEARRRMLRHGNGKTIHDLRVATRRLQAALDVFASRLPEQPRRRLERRARKIRRRLGAGRNAWVTLDLLRGLRGDLTAPEMRLVAGLETEMKKTIKKTPGRGDGGRLPGMRKRLEAVASALDAAESASNGAGDRTARINALSSSAGAVRRAGELAAGGDAESLHRLRIVVKAYRYTLEILSEAGHGGLDRAIRAARILQRDLGSLHDLDVLIEMVRGRAPERGASALLQRLLRARSARTAPVLRRVAGFRPRELTAPAPRHQAPPRTPASRRSPEAGAVA